MLYSTPPNYFCSPQNLQRWPVNRHTQTCCSYVGTVMLCQLGGNCALTVVPTWWQLHSDMPQNKTLSEALVHGCKARQEPPSRVVCNRNTNYVLSLLLQRWEANSKVSKRALSFPAKNLSLDQIRITIQEQSTLNYMWTWYMFIPCYRAKTLQQYFMYVYIHYIYVYDIQKGTA